MDTTTFHGFGLPLAVACVLPVLALPLIMRRVDRGWGETGGKTRAKLLAVLAMAIGWLAIWHGAGPIWNGWPGGAVVLSVVLGRAMGFDKNAATVIDKTSRRRAWIRALVPAALAMGGSFAAWRLGIFPNAVPAFAAGVMLMIYAAIVVHHAVDYGDYLQAAIRAGRPILANDPFNAKLEQERGFASGLALVAWFAATLAFTVAA